MGAGRWWIGWLVVGSVAVATYFSLSHTAQNVLYGVIPLVASLLVVAANRRSGAVRRPWLLIAGMLALSAAAQAVWTWHDLRGEDPFPSAADGLWLTGYAVAFLAVAVLLRQRGEQPAGATIDAAIVALGCGVLAWVFIVSPQAADTSASLAQRALSIAHPVAALLLLAMLARLVFSAVPRTAGLGFLAVGLTALLIADIGFALLVIEDAYVIGHPIDAGWLLGYVLLGAAGLHPDRIDRRRTSANTPMPASRVVVLGLAVALPPGVLIVQGISGNEIDGVVIGTLCLAIFGLVLVRLTQLVRTVGEQARALAELSDTDELTGLPNRRYWARCLPELVLTAHGTGLPLVVALLDLDHFKHYNDGHGHPAGDVLLRRAAWAWRTPLAPTDVLARFGGEEFLLLLPCEDTPAALARLDAVRIATPDGQRCSIGAAILQPGETAEAVLERADAALYRAKVEGRDRTVLDGAEPTDTAPEPVETATG